MVREKDGGRIALSTDARWRMASAISAAVEGISGFGFGGGGGGFFLGLGACEGARLSTGIPIKFLGDVNTDVGGAGGRENVEPGGGGFGLSSGKGAEKRFNARSMAESFFGFSGFSAIGDIGRDAEDSSAEFVSVFVGDRGAGGDGGGGIGSRGGGQAGGGNLPSSVGLVNAVVWEGKPADLSSSILVTTGSASSYRANPWWRMQPSSRSSLFWKISCFDSR